jgi:SDR family mycofactocin-dependent oxidoreductase
MSLLRNKVAFITGAGRGQGRAHAVRLAREGAAVIAADICRPVDSVGYPTSTEEDLAETRRLIEDEGGRVHAAVADVRDREQLAKVLSEGVDQFGDVNIVVANAGIASYAEFHEITPAAWQEMLDINLTGVWHTCVVARPHLIAAGGGSIVITSSAATLKPPANLAHYIAAKHGTVGLMRSLAKELAPYKIRVNSLHPVQVDTPMVMNREVYEMFRPDLDAPGREDIVAPSMDMTLLPIPWVETDDVTNALVFLVSESARYITGVTLPIDAGYHLK